MCELCGPVTRVFGFVLIHPGMFNVLRQLHTVLSSTRLGSIASEYVVACTSSVRAFIHPHDTCLMTHESLSVERVLATVEQRELEGELR